MLEHLLDGFTVALQFKALLGIAIGVLWGIIGGAIPGITGSISMALLLPLTFGLDPLIALPTLAAVYVGAEYGGSVPAILLGTPGTGAAAPTVIDGYMLHKRGEGGKALFASLYSGVVGGILSIILLVMFAIPLAEFGLAFGPAEYFLLALFGLTIVSSLSGESQTKGLISALLGLFIATIGLDPFNATNRFTFGWYQLSEGLDLIPLMIGLFAISEVFQQIFNKELVDESKEKVKIKFFNWAEFKKYTPLAIITGLIGTFIGAMPGAGGSIASWISYSETKRWSRDKDNFGKGELKGVVAPESANNAVPGGALIPLLALGIPGSNSTAVLLGAFMIHGLAPGPLLFTDKPQIPYTIMASMLLAQILMLIIGITLIKPAVAITSVSKKFLCGAIIALAFIGAYAVNNDITDVIFALTFGILGFIMKNYGFSPPAAVLGFVLGPLLEHNFRRALSLTKGDASIFVSSNICYVLIVMIVLSLSFPIIRNILSQRANKKEEKGAEVA